MYSDYIIIGTGLAGLTSALTLVESGTVLFISKDALQSGSTPLAQGGLAAVISSEDTFSKHIQDTMVAGAFYNNQKSVEYLITHAPAAVKWLESHGIKFDKKSDKYLLGKEGAHSERRILHATDFTGKIISNILIRKVKENNNIISREHCFLLDLIIKNNRCFGVNVIENGEIKHYFSKAVVLATGGTGQIYKWTTNPVVSTGDGIAAAFRAGAKIKDMEFIQFHPTALQHGVSPLFLLSEAIRGEGAFLVNENGIRFMQQIHPLAELAPRDIVARAIYLEQQKSIVYLDIRHKTRSYLEKRFPNIYTYLSKLGFDMAIDLLPVTPAAHYSIGGISTNLYGQTSIENLFAFGEVSCNGVHGANRLASNSLLEAVVFPLKLPELIKTLPKQVEKIETQKQVTAHSDEKLISGLKYKLQNLMWQNVGIIRSKKNLNFALERIKDIDNQLMTHEEINRQLCELKNMVLVAKLITNAAIKRKNNLGVHFLAE